MPRIPVQIRGDLTGRWHRLDFLLDTGSDKIIIHSEVASAVGLDITKYDDFGTITTIDESIIPVFFKKGILIKIGNFPAIVVTIGFSPNVIKEPPILGRDILSLFGVVFNSKEMGIFVKQAG